MASRWVRHPYWPAGTEDDRARDMNGAPIEVGDTVVFAGGSRTPELIRGVVIEVAAEKRTHPSSNWAYNDYHLKIRHDQSTTGLNERGRNRAFPMYHPAACLIIDKGDQ
jgi:hypothetical protein